VQEKAFLTNLVLGEGGGRFEAYYSLALLPSVELTLDLQRADGLLQTYDDALILGARLRVNF
jgi:hypothetical protein